MPELVRIHVPERPAPRAHGFVGQRDAPVAEAEAAMQPGGDGVAMYVLIVGAGKVGMFI